MRPIAFQRHRATRDPVVEAARLGRHTLRTANLFPSGDPLRQSPPAAIQPKQLPPPGNNPQPFERRWLLIVYHAQPHHHDLLTRLGFKRSISARRSTWRRRYKDERFPEVDATTRKLLDAGLAVRRSLVHQQPQSGSKVKRRGSTSAQPPTRAGTSPVGTESTRP